MATEKPARTVAMKLKEDEVLGLLLISIWIEMMNPAQKRKLALEVHGLGKLRVSDVGEMKRLSERVLGGVRKLRLALEEFGENYAKSKGKRRARKLR